MDRRALLVVGLLAGAVLVVDGGAFSSVASDRGVTVETASDEDAYMALDTPAGVEGNSSESVTLVTITNQFSEQVAFEITQVTPVNDSLGVDPNSQSVDLDSGHSETVTVQLECDSEVDTTIEFHVDAEGDSVAADTTEPRETDATCTP